MHVLLRHQCILKRCWLVANQIRTFCLSCIYTYTIHPISEVWSQSNKQLVQLQRVGEGSTGPSGAPSPPMKVNLQRGPKGTLTLESLKGSDVDSSKKTSLFDFAIQTIKTDQIFNLDFNLAMLFHPILWSTTTTIRDICDYYGLLSHKISLVDLLSSIALSLGTTISKWHGFLNMVRCLLMRYHKKHEIRVCNV